MNDPTKTRQAQMRELSSLRKRIAELEQAHSQYREMEERLRDSEQRLRGIIANAQSGYFFIDRDGVYRQVNDAWLRMHKYDSPDEIIGRHYSVTQVDADLGKAKRVVEGLLAGDPIPTGEFSRLCKDGSIGYHTFSASPVFSDHEVIGLEGFLTDTTGHKKTLDALQVSEGRFRSIFDNSLDAIQLGLPTGEILSANRAAQSLLGITEEEICRAGRAGIVVQDEALARAIEEREKKGKWRGTLTFRRKDGSTFAAEVSSNVFKAADSGARTITIFRDITERKRAEDDLRVSSEILQRMAGVVLIRARDGVMVYTNPRFERMFGYEPGELFGRHVSTLNAPRDGSPEDVARRIIEELEKTGEWSGEVRNVRKDGSDFWCHARVSSFEHNIHGPVWISSQQDITERKKLQEDLRLSEKKYRAIFDNVPIGIFQSSPEGRYISANVQAARNLGYDSPEELIGTITDMGTQVYRNSEDRRKMARLLEEQGHAENFEAQFIRKDGSTVWGSLNAKTVRDERGEILYYEGTSQDINARKLAEASLRESERRYHDMLSNVELLSVTLDREGRVTFCNDYLLQLTGWRCEEVLGSNWFDLFIPPEQDEGLRRAFAELLNDALPAAWHRENEILTRSGERRFIRWNNTVLHSISGDAIGTASIGEDITDRKKAEEELTTHREHLEELVKERTRELENKTQILEELNAATRALLRQREEDRKELEERFVANMKNLILPYAEKMKRTHLDERQLSYLGIMETHFNEIMSPLMKTMQQSNFTPTESQVASLIKDGKTTKEIAAIMGVATSSIDTHRKSIRRKLGLNNMKANLQSHLQSIVV